MALFKIDVCVSSWLGSLFGPFRIGIYYWVKRSFPMSERLDPEDPDPMVLLWLPIRSSRDPDSTSILSQSVLLPQSVLLWLPIL